MACVLDAVELLKFDLINPDAGVQASALKQLNEALERSLQHGLGENEVKPLAEFYIAKLKGEAQVASSALHGLRSFLSAKAPSLADWAVPIAQGIFNETMCPSLPAKDRFVVYTILHELVKEFSIEITKMGLDFIIGFMQAFEGEKDPKNLLIALDLFALISGSLPLEHLAEDFFECVACYYPVQFKPPSNDPYGITKPELEEKVVVCLVSSPVFCDLSLQLVQEKCSSDEPDELRQSVKLLATALAQFPSELYAKEIPMMLDYFRKIMLAKELDQVLLQITREAIAVLAKQLDMQDEASVTKTIDAVCDGCQPFILNSSVGRVEVASSLALLVAENLSIQRANYMRGKVLPTLLEKAQSIRVDEIKVVYLKCSRDWFLLENCEEVIDHGLAIATRLLCLQCVDSIHAGKESQVALAGVEMAGSLTHIGAGLSATGTGDVTGTVLQDGELDRVLSCALTLLQQIDDSVTGLSLGRAIIYLLHLKVVEEQIAWFERIILLKKKLSLCGIFEQKTLAILKHIFPELIRLVVNLVKQAAPDEELPDATSLKVQIVTLSQFASSLLADLDADQKDVILRDIFELLRSSTLKISNQSMLLTLYRYLVPCASEQFLIQFAIEQTEWLTSALYRLDSEKIHQESMDISAILGSFFNKLPQGAVLEKILASIDTLLKEEKLPSHCVYYIAGHTTKALIMRSHPTGDAMLQQILNDMNDPTNCTAVSETIRLLVDEEMQLHDVAKFGSTIRFLWRQKVMATVATFLMEGYPLAKSDTKSAYLSALGALLSSNFDVGSEKLYPILLSAFDNAESVPLGLLEAFQQLLSVESFRNFLQPALPNVIDNLNKVALDSSININIRLAAVVSISEIPRKYPLFVIGSLLKPVRKQLAPLLEDKKRLIRTAGGSARNAWYMVEA